MKISNRTSVLILLNICNVNVAFSSEDKFNLCNKEIYIRNSINIIIKDEGRPTEFIAAEEPAVDVQLRVPYDYLESAILPTSDILREDGEIFRMRLSDGKPVLRSPETSKLQQEDNDVVDFLVSDQFEINRIIAISVTSEMPEPYEPSWEHVALNLKKTEIKNLFSISNKRDKFFAANSEKYTDVTQDILLECDNIASVPFPLCTMKFDAENLNVKATFSLKNLSKWERAKSLIQSFLACAHVRDIPVRKDGVMTWR